ncbi:MAG: hypothetical protein MPJ50_01930 [Pirellulales bacterium]|nr:hypothetical protein [Pirellulales bacterium]
MSSTLKTLDQCSSPVSSGTGGVKPGEPPVLPADPASPQSNRAIGMQFSLRTLMIAVAAIASLLAILLVVNTLTAVLLVWFALLVFCHVAANAWGSKTNRREITPSNDGLSRGALKGNRQITRGTAAALQAAETELACAQVPPSHLSHRRALSWWLFLPIPAGAILGAYAGIVILFGGLENVSDWKTLAVASISSAALGGFSAFLVSSFLGVALLALFDAQRHAAKR